MKNKKLILVIALIILLSLVGGLTYYFLTKEDKVTTLNLFEKQWIESNKNNVIDMSIVNDIPVLSYNGEGLIIDFLDSLKEQTNLSFNKVSYKVTEEAKSSYAIKMVEEVSDNDILIYEDNYVILTKDVKKYTSLKELNGLTIGVINNTLDKVNNALFDSDITYQGFENVDKLLEEFNKVDTTLNAICLLKTANLKTIFENNYSIAYNINDYKTYFVLSLGDTDKLNAILTKYYEKWSNENYIDSYNKYLSKNYFNFKDINDSESVKFRSKRYTYGYIENSPYDTEVNSKLVGINSKLLSSFSKLTNAEISYKAYDSMEDLLRGFNSNQIDFFYGMNNDTKYALDVYETVDVYQNPVVVLKYANNTRPIDSIKSLQNVYTIQGTKLDAYLTSNGVSTTSHTNLNELLKNLNNDSIIALDLENYNSNKDKLQNYVIAYQFDFENYPFVIRSISDNKIFSEFFNFYLGFTETDTYITEGVSELVLVNKTPFILRNVALILGTVVGVLLVVLVIMKVRPKKKKVNLSKEDKLRYIDALTSLKNRNYLNDSLEKWDSSEIYPQAIVIVDLNNIAYINDNYGHTEGDAVIKQAANILIQNQIENSEIIRTNGNEFLIYLVEHEEKQVITYMRKLNKELKELTHGFGAAIGYSMIQDAIKTIDDAINEATLDMKNNKEEANKEG